MMSGAAISSVVIFRAGGVAGAECRTLDIIVRVRVYSVTWLAWWVHLQIPWTPARYLPVVNLLIERKWIGAICSEELLVPTDVRVVSLLLQEAHCALA